MKNEAPKSNLYPVATVAVFIVAASIIVVLAYRWTPTGDTLVVGANVDTSKLTKGLVLGEISDGSGNVEHPDWKWFEEATHGFRVRIPDSHEVVTENSGENENEYGLTAAETWQIAPKADASGEYPAYPALLSVSVFSNPEKVSIGTWHQKEIAGWNIKADVCRTDGPKEGCETYADAHPTDRQTVFQEWFAVETLHNSFDVLQSCEEVDHGGEVVKLCIVRYAAPEGTAATRLAEEIGSTFEFTK